MGAARRRTSITSAELQESLEGWTWPKEGRRRQRQRRRQVAKQIDGNEAKVEKHTIIWVVWRLWVEWVEWILEIMNSAIDIPLEFAQRVQGFLFEKSAKTRRSWSEVIWEATCLVILIGSLPIALVGFLLKGLERCEKWLGGGNQWHQERYEQYLRHMKQERQRHVFAFQLSGASESSDSDSDVWKILYSDSSESKGSA